MSNSDNVAVTVNILDKEYRVACAPEEQRALLDSANILSERMREIRDSGKVVGADRVAVMAALNLTHELLQNRDQRDNLAETVATNARSLQERIGLALEDSRQLEL